MSGSARGSQSTPKSQPRKRDRLLAQFFRNKKGPSRDPSPPPTEDRDVSSEGPTLPDKFNDGVGVVWSGVETTLRILKECSDWNPILKSAVGGIVACIEVVGVRRSEIHPDTDLLRIPII